MDTKKYTITEDVFGRKSIREVPYYVVELQNLVHEGYSDHLYNFKDAYDSIEFDATIKYNLYKLNLAHFRDAVRDAVGVILKTAWIMTIHKWKTTIDYFDVVTLKECPLFSLIQNSNYVLDSYHYDEEARDELSCRPCSDFDDEDDYLDENLVSWHLSGNVFESGRAVINENQFNHVAYHMFPSGDLDRNLKKCNLTLYTNVQLDVAKEILETSITLADKMLDKIVEENAQDKDLGNEISPQTSYVRSVISVAVNSFLDYSIEDYADTLCPAHIAIKRINKILASAPGIH